jgi:hypothetical protein
MPDRHPGIEGKEPPVVAARLPWADSAATADSAKMGLRAGADSADAVEAAAT